MTPLLVFFLAGSFLNIDAGSMVLDIVKTVLLPVIGGSRPASSSRSSCARCCRHFPGHPPS
ncbi:bile acid protein [Arthrobacter sp. Hiyo8]|nr:bile acid protein [Arthrobacter sp. Hiyo8]